MLEAALGDDDWGMLPQIWLRTTVMRLVVSVPVLSEQIVVALPIVSQAYKCLTRLLSDIILYRDHTHTQSQRHSSNAHDTRARNRLQQIGAVHSTPDSDVCIMPPGNKFLPASKSNALFYAENRYPIGIVNK